MLRSAILITLLVVPRAVPAETPPTLRLDYYHTGNAEEELFSLDAVVLEGPWPGNPARPLDDTGLGPYRFEVVDPVTREALYSRGFASIYGEWETTEEARLVNRTFHESLRFPEPEGPVQVIVQRRGPDGLFREAWTVLVDPDDPTVDRTGPPPADNVWAVLESGPPSDKVDLVLLGDGYTSDEMAKWHKDARRMADILFGVAPFRDRRTDFNVWAVDTPSRQSGVARPSDGVFRRSALRVTYDAFGSERYVLGFDNKRLREVAAAAPYDVMVIVVNGRKYGGGGIFNLFATVSSDNAFTPYILVHEFGHSFAGLADEYYTSSVAFESSDDRPEPWAWNATAHPESPKWLDLVTPGTPLPTPWAKEEFEAAQEKIQARRRQIRAEGRPEEEMEELFRREQETVDALLQTGPYAHAVGAFEGAQYEAHGYYRPQANCMMFTRTSTFCAVCRRALATLIDLYSRPGP